MEKIEIGLLGYGNVGQGFAQCYTKCNSEFREYLNLGTVCFKNPDKARNFNAIPNFQSVRLTTDCARVVSNPEINVVINTIGGTKEADETSYELTKSALRNKKHVVTANKANLAYHLGELTQIAKDNNVFLRYEASVAASIPIITTLQSYYKNEPIKKITAILNGTSNYILSQMHQGSSYAQALRSAQKAGCAEANPAFDVNGTDATNKLAILASIAFNTKITPRIIYNEGIEHIGKDDFFYVRDNLKLRTGKYHTIKHIAKAELIDDVIDIRVHPAYIDERHPLFGTDNTLNSICIEGALSGTHLMRGKGAGPLPTGFAMMSDLEQILQKINQNITDTPQTFANKVSTVVVPKIRGFSHNFDPITFGYIKSRSPEHQVGILAKKAQILADKGISIQDWFNFVERAKGNVDEIIPDVFLIDKTEDAKVLAAVSELENSEVVNGEVHYIRGDVL